MSSSSVRVAIMAAKMLPADAPPMTRGITLFSTSAFTTPACAEQG
jgi:hypothetical protein